MLRNKRSHCNKKPAYGSEGQAPLAATREKPTGSNEDPTQSKINKLNKLKKNAHDKMLNIANY